MASDLPFPRRVLRVGCSHSMTDNGVTIARRE
jgi:hypothetical protein